MDNGKVKLTMNGEVVDVDEAESTDASPLLDVYPMIFHNDVDALVPVLNFNMNALPALTVNFFVCELKVTV